MSGLGSMEDAIARDSADDVPSLRAQFHVPTIGQLQGCAPPPRLIHR